MARRITSSTSNTQAECFLNIVLRDGDGNEFTLGGKALPSSETPRGSTLPCRIVRKLWDSAQNMNTGEFPFPTHGSFQQFLASMGVELILKVRRTDDVATSDDGGDDIAF